MWNQQFVMMENFDVNELLKNVKSIQDQTQYWLIRTMGGDYYTEYVGENYVAVGYNEITIEDLKYLPPKDKQARIVLQTILKDRRNSIRNAGYPASQILRFAREIREGDIIIVPSSSSFKVTFGVIKSDLYQEIKNLHLEGRCPFSKRRKVEWLKTVPRHLLPPELQLMFNSRHIISEVNSYAPFIDSFLNDFYTKGDNTYLVLRVKQEQILSADDFTLVNDLMELFNEYSVEHDMGLTSKDIKMKMSVQSPGDILTFAPFPEAIAVIGFFIMFIKGGTFSMNWGGFHLETKVPTAGETFSKVASSVNLFLNDSRRRSVIKKLEKKLDNMDIETPAAIIELMKELGKDRDSESGEK